MYLREYNIILAHVYMNIAYHVDIHLTFLKTNILLHCSTFQYGDFGCYFIKIRQYYIIRIALIHFNPPIVLSGFNHVIYSICPHYSSQKENYVIWLTQQLHTHHPQKKNTIITPATVHLPQNDTTVHVKNRLMKRLPRLCQMWITDGNICAWTPVVWV